tara:strand:- start:136 stop:543 length:408 start_codon:yes stop_codon:yes gene_type:complete
MNNQILQEEEQFIDAFIYSSKKNRTLGLLRSKKRRSKILSKLYHYSDFDSRFLKKIDASIQFSELILNLLLEKGANRMCYVISASRSDLDQTTKELSGVLNEVVGYCPGTIIICRSNHLAYYEGEMNNERYLLER